jgi:hypothetical protein
MKTLIRTITVFITLNLITAGFTLAQPTPTPPEPAEVEAVEIAAKEAQERAKAVQKHMESLHLNLGMSLPGSGAGTVLVIPTSEMKTEELVTIIEDMTVMSRILERQLGQEQPKHMWFTGGRFNGDIFGQSSMSETMYLQDYGALFLKKFDFPLSPGPAMQEEEKETTEEGVDLVWEQMKKDIYEPQENRRRREKRPEEKYDAEKVENLKTDLIKALKHASNIRSLKPDESVIITVTGSSASSKTTGIAIAGRGLVLKQNNDNKSVSIVTPNTPLIGDWGTSSSTLLIIRAKKSDIDAFAEGDSDIDKFRQRVQIFTQ